MTSIDIISDLHGFQPELEGGDLLIICGDLTALDTLPEYRHFNDWLIKQNYREKIIIAGNHDVQMYPNGYPFCCACQNLDDSLFEFDGLKIYGTSWNLRFPHQNHRAMAFSLPEYQLKDHFDKIPSGLDILVTHGPPFGFLDECSHGRTGSLELLKAIDRTRPKYVIFGHIHECGGMIRKEGDVTFINASVVNKHYEHVNAPIRIEL